jgi:hypothetical protein
VPAGLYATPSLTLREGYDDNIQDAVQGSTQKEGDFVFRTEPAIVAGYRSAPFSLLANYLIAADVYAQHSSLDSFPSRQDADVTIDYLPDPRLDLSANGGYQESQYASQLNSAAASETSGLPATGISNGRARTTLYYAGAAAKYALTPLDNALADYVYDHNHQVGSPSNDSHSVDGRYSHRFTETDVGDLGFIYRHFTSSNSGTSSATPEPTPPTSVLVLPSVTDSYAPTLGWSHQFSALTEVAVRGGPRFSDDASVHAEAYASITRRLARGQANFVYQNTQSSAAGNAGAVNVSSYTGSLAYNLMEQLTSGIYLSLYQSSNPGQGHGKITDVYTAGMSLRYRLLEWLSIVMNYDFSYQDGVLTPLPSTTSDIVVVQGNSNIQRNIVSIGLEASEPFRLY